MREIREDYLIRVESAQENNGDVDSISLMTKGEFAHRGHSFYITYRETEATGFAGCATTVKADESSRKVSMLRFGPISGQLILEKGQRHICHYETGQGSLSLGLAADEICCALNEDGGKLHFSYLLDFDGETLSHNVVDVTVRRADPSDSVKS